MHYTRHALPAPIAGPQRELPLLWFYNSYSSHLISCSLCQGMLKHAWLLGGGSRLVSVEGVYAPRHDPTRDGSDDLPFIDLRMGLSTQNWSMKHKEKSSGGS